MALWLIEGLPGAGKTTMADQLCAYARNAGYVAQWYLEESDDHPVHSKAIKARRRDGSNFVEVCLQSWSDFVDSAQHENVLHIMEGSAFQSTVRFMMEERLAGIDDYYRRFEEIICSLNPRMVYLRARDPFLHSQDTARHRGKVWSERVSNYLENTCYSLQHGLRGPAGMHRFWGVYARLCDKLVASTRMPVKVIDIVPGEWGRHMSEAREFLRLLDKDAA